MFKFSFLISAIVLAVAAVSGCAADELAGPGRDLQGKGGWSSSSSTSKGDKTGGYKSYKSRKGGKIDLGKPKDAKTVGKTTSGSFSSTAICSARGVAASFSSAKNAHVLAITDSFAKLCGSSGGYASALAIAWAKARAEAVAKAMAGAEVECTTVGKAYGCAAAKASSKAYASAVAEGLAVAWAKAVAGCKPCKAAAKAEAYGVASLHLKLIAKAEAQAKAKACASGNAVAKASAYIECLSAQIVNIYALAIAEAAAVGKCTKAEASADILADVTANFKSTNVCTKALDTKAAAGYKGDSEAAAKILGGAAGSVSN